MFLDIGHISLDPYGHQVKEREFLTIVWNKKKATFIHSVTAEFQSLYLVSNRSMLLAILEAGSLWLSYQRLVV